MGKAPAKPQVHPWCTVGEALQRVSADRQEKNWTRELGCKGQGSEAAIALGESHKLPDFVRLGTTEIKSAREA